MVLLSKGLEIEMYTGSPEGEIVGLSDRIVRDLDGFVREPDSRNVEYTTAPYCNYERLLCAILKPRRALRAYLQKLGDYTIVPGSTLSLGNSRHFYRSDPYNPYHDYIEQVYGTKVVTSSVHINIGIEDPEALMQACRLARVEAPLYLALSASSPFLDGQITGSHSTRWQLFPQTPHHVPLFASHSHYVQWTEEQLVLGTMQNVRHLWTSVRPNGDNRPYNLNRLELRVCDLVMNPLTLLGIVALLEARLTQLKHSPQLDPLLGSRFSEAELLEITTANEQAAARYSLDATLTHWQDGRTLLARDWIDELYQEVIPLAQTGGYSNFLSSVQEILSHGNTAQQWLKDYESGMDIKSIIRQSIPYAQQQEQALEKHLCQPSLVA